MFEEPLETENGLARMESRGGMAAIAVVVGLILLGLFALASLGGCNGVTLNATYSQTLDQTAALSKETADRNRAGGLTPAQVQQSLDGQAATWQLFRDARDGKASPSASSTTQPAN